MEDIKPTQSLTALVLSWVTPLSGHGSPRKLEKKLKINSHTLGYIQLILYRLRSLISKKLSLGSKFKIFTAFGLISTGTLQAFHGQQNPSSHERDDLSRRDYGFVKCDILKKGYGQTVQPYNSPLIRWKKETSEAEETKDQVLHLDEAIPGLKIGIVGMREGEVRKIYIDSLSDTLEDLGIGPLIFQVEIISADASSGAHAASNADSLPLLHSFDEERSFVR